MALIECIPNISDGRHMDVVEACRNAVRATGVRLLDVSSDSSHHRTVLTVAGSADHVETAVLALFAVAIRAIDLRHHHGVHPRMGAVDVVPFVPLGETSMATCVALSRRVGAEVARRHDLPVYLYGQSASSPARQALEFVRRGQFEGLEAKMQQPGWAPDFGPLHPHRTAGATAIGARGPLIAFNVNLCSTRVDIARVIATKIRASSGGLPSVKALGVRLPDRGIVQVSMNLVDYRVTSPAAAYDAVVAEAARCGVDVLEAELIGLVPAAALAPGDAARLRIDERQILEHRLEDVI